MQTFKTRADYQRVQKGRKWVTPAFILQGLARSGNTGGAPRFGFTVSSKSVAKEGGAAKKRGMAVDRNRARRRLKEAVRLTFENHALRGFDYAIIGRAPALNRDFAVLIADMEAAFGKVNRQPAQTASHTVG